MTKVTMIGVMIFLGMLLASCEAPPHGSPTPVDQTLAWDTYTDPDGIGFFPLLGTGGRKPETIYRHEEG